MRGTRVLPINYLRKRLRYEPDTGKFFWLDYEGKSQNWRTRYVGKEAFTTDNGAGYRQGCIDSGLYLAHRVAYAIYHGEWPTDQIDHINGVKADNRITNLRIVTNQENCRNVSMRGDNTSGVTGVYWHKNGQKWCARIKIDGKYIHLGLFDTLEEAAAVRKAASEKYGFTDRHGLPTNVGEACD